MVKRKIIWTKTVDLQLVGILEYWIKKINQLVIQRSYCRKLLSVQHKSPFLPRFIKKKDFANTRVASLGNYSIFYKNFDSEIIITAFWDRFLTTI
jgi:hypothetical protein